MWNALFLKTYQREGNSKNMGKVIWSTEAQLIEKPWFGNLVYETRNLSIMLSRNIGHHGWSTAKYLKKILAQTP